MAPTTIAFFVVFYTILYYALITAWERSASLSLANPPPSRRRHTLLLYCKLHVPPNLSTFCSARFHSFYKLLAVTFSSPTPFHLKCRVVYAYHVRAEGRRSVRGALISSCSLLLVAVFR